MDVGYIIAVLVAILFSMTLHEAMHGFVAYALGDDTAKLQGRLTLNPVKHIDPFLTILLPLLLAAVGAPIFGGAKPVPFNPARLKYDEWGMALVAIAGPLTNLILAFVSFGLFVVLHGSSPLLSDFFQLSSYVNLGFFAFNIIPLPPLDGSRVLYAVAPDGFRRGMEWFEQYGFMVLFGVVLVASPLIGVYIGAVIDACTSVFRVIFPL